MSTRSRRVTKTLAVLVLALAALYAVLLLASTRALRNAYRALEQDGRPMKAEQIIPPPVPDAENGALLFQAAAARLRAEPCLGNTNLFSRLNDLSAVLADGSLDQAGRAELQSLLAREPAPSCLQMVRDGIDRPACRFPLDYSKGPGILLPHLTEMRAFSRILGAQARLQAEAGDPAAAWDTAILSLRLGQKLDKEPTLVSQLVRLAQFRISLSTIRKLAEQTLPSETQTETMTAFLFPCDDVSPLVLGFDSERLLLGEWCFDHVNIKNLSLLDEGDDSILWPHPALLRYWPIWNRDHAAHLNVMRQLTQRAVAPFAPDDLTIGDAILRDVPRYCIMTRLLTPALGPAKRKAYDLSAESRVTQAGLAVLRHKRATGTWPDSLDAAGAGAFRDPYDGKPLRYTKTETGAAIYSVGSNLKDDGGSDQKDDNNQPIDIVWKF